MRDDVVHEHLGLRETLAGRARLLWPGVLAHCSPGHVESGI